MDGLTLTPKELARLQVLNGMMERLWPVTKAAEVLGVTERHVWPFHFWKGWRPIEGRGLPRLPMGTVGACLPTPRPPMYGKESWLSCGTGMAGSTTRILRSC